MRSVAPLPIPVVDDPLAGSTDKPRHRGRLHQLAFLASIPAGIALIGVAAHTVNGRVAAAVYALSVTGLFFTSSLYNRLAGTGRMRSWMRWLDHAMIYVLIAGSYTPVCWIALPRSWSVPVLAVVWTAALGGVVMKLTSLKRFRRTGGTLYVVLGLFSVIALPKLVAALSSSALVLLVVGGVAYLVGATLLWLRRPNPHRDFGYHEVWHTFVFVAAACHFGMTWITLAGAT
jgi:hemolysin III